MRILYLSSSYLPARGADSVHVMKMCAALARAGHTVELVAKRQTVDDTLLNGSIHSFYGVEENFALTRLPRPSPKGGGLVFSYALLWLLQRRSRSVDLVYAREIAGAYLAVRFALPTIFEAHGPARGRLSHHLHRALLASPHLRRFVVISHALRQWFAAAWDGLDATKLVVVGDAADPLPELGKNLRAPNRVQVGYVGHLYPGRGIDLIVDIAADLPECDFHLVGGAPADLARWSSQRVPPNVRFHGFVKPAELPRYYAEFDVLLMPYQHKVGVQSGRSDTAQWMSPMKMFEYMASGRAIVSSDLPVLREVLEQGHNALLVPPEDRGAWIAALRRLISERDLRLELGIRARQDFLARHTWDARVGTVLRGLA